MKDEKLNAAYRAILDQLKTIIEKGDSELQAWDVLHKKDKDISLMFDDLKRSSAILKLAAWKRNGLPSEAELEQFSDQTRETIKALFKY